MVCIYCGSKTSVINSRHQRRLKQVWRRRKCLSCHKLFSTIERLNLSNSLLIRNKKGEIEGFVKEKLLFSIHDSLKHREYAVQDAISITDTVISNILNQLKSPLIERSTLISITHKVLNNFDRPAAVYYLAYNKVDEAYLKEVK